MDLRALTLAVSLNAFAIIPTFAQVTTNQPADAFGTSAALSALAGEGSASEVLVPRLDIEKPKESSRSANRAAPLSPNPLTAALTLASTTTNYQAFLPNLTSVSLTKNFPGLGRGFNANWTDQFLVPPDPTLAVGPTQIVQWVNVRLTVMDKDGNALIGGALGYINGNAIWAGLPAGSICRDSNNGDPMVQYDRLADRWVLSQFAFDLNQSGPIAPFARCIAVSTSGDATGTYALYQYVFDALPDYPKLGVWPDAYYFSSNDFAINPANGSSIYVGARLCAYDRAAMIAGLPNASQICTQRFTNRFSFLPADLDGSTLPPPGAPNYVVSQDWFFRAAPPYSIRLQKFKPDFVTPANSTFDDGIGGGPNSFIGIPFSDIRGACDDFGDACVPQPGTPRVLDTLSMRPMYRLAYRNRSGVESLVFTHAVDPPVASVVATMHWVEIRNPGSATPVLFQNGAIGGSDGVNRWMGSAAMDKAGNIALGYSVSSSTVSPGIRIAGRLRTDIRNNLRGELNAVTGTGAQTSTAQRWGDYSAMQIDPVDDCTFWYTQAYMTGVFTRDWSTRVLAFKFPNCGF